MLKIKPLKLKSQFCLRSMLMIACMGFMGCREVSVQDGKIPARYLSQAQVFTGTYHGTLNLEPDTGAWAYFPTLSRDASLKVTIEYGRPRFTFSRDYADDNCRTAIGELQKVSINDDGTVGSATFAFNTIKSCNTPTWGNTISVNFSMQGGKPRLSFGMRGGQMGYIADGGNEFTEISLTGTFDHE